MNFHLSVNILRVISAAAVVGTLAYPVLSDEAEKPPSGSSKETRANGIKLEDLVADVLEHNPELNFYNAEIAAAKGEARTAATWANPDISTTIGAKRATGEGPTA